MLKIEAYLFLSIFIRESFIFLSFSVATVNSTTNPLPANSTTPTLLENNPPPSSIGPNIAGSFPNQVASKMKIFIILGFLLVGFVTGLIIAVSLAFAIKCYRKKKKWKLTFSSE